MADGESIFRMDGKMTVKEVKQQEPAALDSQESELCPRYRVLLHNDSVNEMEYVARCVARVFALEWGEAWAVMSEAHNTGVGLCTVEPFEPAEFHRDQLRSFDLDSTIEKNNS